MPTNSSIKSCLLVGVVDANPEIIQLNSDYLAKIWYIYVRTRGITLVEIFLGGTYAEEKIHQITPCLQGDL